MANSMFLTKMCVPLTKEHRLMEDIVTSNSWAKPIKVYGYDDSVEFFGGQAYEADTNCVAEHNMGAIPSSGFNNLAWHSNRPPIEAGELKQPPNPHSGEEYDPEKTYVTFIVGDGDNLEILRGRNLSWLLGRQRRCSGTGSKCFPLVWSFSPQAVRVMPEFARHAYSVAAATGADFFNLPASGDMYSYPSTMNEPSRSNYIETMEVDWEIMGSTTSVHWEWFYSWLHTVDRYFSRFGGKGPRGFFLTTVPYLFPMPIFFGRDEDFKVVGPEDNVVLFKSNEWKGVTGKSHEATAREMAAKLNKREKGGLTHLYMTSDGNNALDSFYLLAEQLDEHVMIVNDETLVDLALQKHKRTSK